MTDQDQDDFSPWDDQWGTDEAPVIAVQGELTPVPFSCAGCGERNETMLDLGAGYSQQFTEDCAVCCRPNLITIEVDSESLEVSIRNELEYDC